MIEDVGLHAADEANIVDDLAMVRQEVAQPRPGLPVLAEFAVGTE